MTSDPTPWDQPDSDAAENRHARLGILDRVTCRSCGYGYLPRAYPPDAGLCSLCERLTAELESISKEARDQGEHDLAGLPPDALTG